MLTIKYHLTLVRTSHKKIWNNLYLQRCGKTWTFFHCQCECCIVKPLCKLVCRFLRKVIKLSYVKQFHLLVSMCVQDIKSLNERTHIEHNLLQSLVQQLEYGIVDREKRNRGGRFNVKGWIKVNRDRYLGQINGVEV